MRSFHDYFAGVLESFKETAERNDYDITFVNRNKERRRQMTYLEHARYRGFDGVVIACVDFEDLEVAQLVASDIPVVTIDHIFNNRIAVMSDNVKGMESLLQFIYSRGHRRIAYIHGHASSVTGSRLSSFYKTAEELGLDIPDEYVLEAGYRDTDAAAAATEELLKLPGVGRKTANLILGDVYHTPGVVVADTHCIRISGLLGLTDGTKDPGKVEQQLRAILPPEESNDFCHRLVLHGRAVCIARRPQCQSCVLRPWCDHFAKSGQTARGTEGREPA